MREVRMVTPKEIAAKIRLLMPLSDTQLAGFLTAHSLEIAAALERLDAAEDVVIHARELVDAMETCHICSSTVLVGGPVYCEDCSDDCERHEEPECDIRDTHRRLKETLAVVEASKRKEKP